MRKEKLGRRLRLCRFAAFAGSAALWPAGLTLAGTDNWIANSGSWSVPGNWSPANVPGAGDDVVIGFTDGLNRTVTYDYTGPAVTLDSLTLDLTNFSGTASSLLEMSANNLTANNEYLGVNGAGGFVQTGGLNTVSGSGNLYLGTNNNSIGTYNIAGGLLSAKYMGIGQNGSGDLNQSGGMVNAADHFSVGDQPGSSGAYSLSGNGVLTANYGDVGYLGTGSFVQTGGINTIATDLYLALGAGSTGTYSLSAGTLSSSYIGIGQSGSGTLTQTGGTVTTSDHFSVGDQSSASGTYSLSGNSVLSAFYGDVGFKGTGTFTQTGGSDAIATDLYLGGTFMGGAGTGTYSLSGTGSLSATESEFVGYNGTGIFNQSGGTNTVGALGNLYLGYNAGSTGTYSLSSTGSLSDTDTSGNEFVGYAGTGFFNQSGGTNFNADGLTIGNNSGSTGTYALSGDGSLSSVNGYEEIGYNGTGVFDQTGGTNTISGNAYVIMGRFSGSTGTYILSGTGSLSDADNEYVGYNGVGIFNQSGGTNSIGALGNLYLGYNTGSTGTYNLSGTGSLSDTDTSANEFVGYGGTGVFNQSGGTNFNADGLTIANNGGSTGMYTLSGGSLISVYGYEYVGYYGTGLFKQTGGTNTISGNAYVILGRFSGSTGTYVLTSTGSLSDADNEYVGYNGTGIFNQCGGTNTIGALGSLYLGDNPGSTGTYNLSGTGSLSETATNGNEFVGSGGTGIFNQTGGTNFTADGLTIGNDNGSTGTYALSGGTLISAYGYEYVGYCGTGLFNQTGGTNTISGNAYVILGRFSGSTGTYALSGAGSLSDADNEYVGYDGTGIFNQSSGINTIGALGSLYLGDNAGSTGTYNLSGNASLSDTDTSGNEFVGYAGTGVFNQTGGTNFNADGLTIANNSGSTGTYALSGGTLSSVYGYEEIGYNGTGLFNQTGGTNTISGNAYVILGRFSGSTGTYVLTNTGSLSDADNEYLGYTGTGIFNQSAGTNTIGSFGSLYLGYNAGSTGTYNLSGTGALSVGSNEYVGDYGAGTITQAGGTNKVGGALVIAANAGSTGTYNLQGGTLTAGAVIVNSGGSYTQTGGTATFAQITGGGRVSISGGTTMLSLGGGASQVSNLSISGPGTLDITNNTLEINYVPGNSPAGMIRQWLTTGYGNDTWTGPGIDSSAAAPNPGRFAIGYADGNVDQGTAAGANQVLVEYTLAGDANLDGLVNFADLLVVAQNFNHTVDTHGNPIDWADGDFNYDDKVNFADLLLVAQNFNQTLSAGQLEQLPGSFSAAWDLALAEVQSSESNNVPEPASAALLALAAAGLLTRRQRKGHDSRSASAHEKGTFTMARGHSKSGSFACVR